MLSRKQNIAYDIILHVVIVMWPTQSFVSLHYHSQLLSGSKVSIEGTLWNLTGNSHAAFHLLLFEYNILFFFISREIFNIGHSDCVFMMQFYVIMTSSNYIKTSLSSFEQLTDLLLSTSMKIGWQQWIRFSVNK